MGMGGGGGTNHAVSDINVTPLIDVLLVLLIIFAGHRAGDAEGIWTRFPSRPRTRRKPKITRAPLLFRFLSSRGAPPYKINEDAFAKASWSRKLAEIFASRQEKVMFVKVIRISSIARSPR